MEVTMRLWTLQPITRLVQLEQDNIIHGSWDHVEQIDEDEPDYWTRPYLWMCQQMEARLPTYSYNPPIWAWTEKPDLRWFRHNWNEQGWCVRIEFDAPEERFLISNYDFWHTVLNRYPFTVNEAEWTDFWTRWDARRKELRDQSLSRREADDWVFLEMYEEIDATWQRIFDLTLHRACDEGWVGAEPTYQACVDGLDVSWVRKVDLFRPRERRREP
jgi:hypothetical protein